MIKNSRRLIAAFKPEHYDAEINIFPETMTFKGNVKINGLKTGPPSHRITFHQQNLKIGRVSITRHNKLVDQSMTIDRVNHHRGFGEVRLHTKEQLYGGLYSISMDYQGRMNEVMKKLFYGAVRYNKKRPDVKQIESYFNCKLLPCIDEPDAKTIYELTLFLPESKIFITNDPSKKKI